MYYNINYKKNIVIIEMDLNKISDKVYNITGERSYIIRFPGGSSNIISKNYKNGIMSLLAKEVENKGYVYFGWNVGSSDTVTSSSKKTCNNVKKALELELMSF